ncbi:MAG: hypothetical protein AB7P69_05575 [Candidatus Binatia bacterium]
MMACAFAFRAAYLSFRLLLIRLPCNIKPIPETERVPVDLSRDHKGEVNLPLAAARGPVFLRATGR